LYEAGKAGKETRLQRMSEEGKGRIETGSKQT